MFRVLSDPAIYQFENEPPPSEEWLTRRYARLENRVSAEGTQIWLNWVVRLPCGELAGYVQATVFMSGAALVAYELASRHWRRGIGRSGLSAVIDELNENYATALFAAVLKSTNFRSEGLLVSLGFEPASEEQAAQFGAEPDEKVMVKLARRTEVAA